MTLYTIGFTGTSARHFFDRLRVAAVSGIVDTRLNNISQLAGFAKRGDLEFFLSAILGVSYAECQLLAPTSDMLRRYRAKEMSWDEYASQYVALLEDRPIKRSVLPILQDKACLLCSEADSARCHRRLAADYIASIAGYSIDIEHL